MADVDYEITREKSLDNKVPCLALNDIIMDTPGPAAPPALPRPGKRRAAPTLAM